MQVTLPTRPYLSAFPTASQAAGSSKVADSPKARTNCLSAPVRSGHLNKQVHAGSLPTSVREPSLLAPRDFSPVSLIAALLGGN